MLLGCATILYSSFSSTSGDQEVPSKPTLKTSIPGLHFAEEPMDNTFRDDRTRYRYQGIKLVILLNPLDIHLLDFLTFHLWHSFCSKSKQPVGIGFFVVFIFMVYTYGFLGGPI